MSETYKVELYTRGPYVGCESTEVYDLSEYGYTDEEWDELPPARREELLNEWGLENFWNSGYEYSAEVKRG